MDTPRSPLIHLYLICSLMFFGFISNALFLHVQSGEQNSTGCIYIGWFVCFHFLPTMTRILRRKNLIRNYSKEFPFLIPAHCITPMLQYVAICLILPVFQLFSCSWLHVWSSALLNHRFGTAALVFFNYN